ncbi:DUF3108 domain-containing protein [Arhodomonas sp. SL1]|uniref:DUF3108 domain-containing protein n=1 Tax=Arhodomonas sp. SL1 TaxID=3425691 RepID=UPI003F884649
MKVLLLTGLLAVIAATPAPAAEAPPPFEAEYRLDRGILTLGRATLTFSRPTPERYLYRMYTRPTGIAGWFTSARIRERSMGLVVEDGFRPLRYTYERSGDDRARRAELQFDWGAGEVVNDVDDPPWRMEVPPDALDRVVSPLQLMHDLAVREPGEDSLTYRIADGGELKTYTVTIEGEETIDTPAGRFETVKVVRRDEEGKRETRMWCAPELDYLAVRIEQWERDDGTFELLLTGIEGLARN